MRQVSGGEKIDVTTMHRNTTDMDASIGAGLGGEEIDFTTMHRDATDVNASIEAGLGGAKK